MSTQVLENTTYRSLSYEYERANIKTTFGYLVVAS